MHFKGMVYGVVGSLLPLATASAESAIGLELPSGEIVLDVTYTGGGASTYVVKFPGVGAGYGVNGSDSYLAWCAEDNGEPTYFWGEVFLSDDDGMPLDLMTYQESDIPIVQSGGAALGDAIPWDQVSWILNHRIGNAYDIQAAIWQLVWGQSSTFELSANAVQMVSDAKTIGVGFSPAPGQIAAVLGYYDGIGHHEHQEIVIEVPVPELPLEPTPTPVPEVPTPEPTPPIPCEALGTSPMGVGYADGSLAWLDVLTGTMTPSSMPQLALQGLTSMAFHPSDGSLYLVTGEGDDSLYRLPAGASEAVRIGALTGGASNVQGMDFAPAAAVAFGYTPGALYAVSIDGMGHCGPNCLFMIDPATAEALPLASIQANQIRGVSFHPVTGELTVYDPGGKVLSALLPDGTLKPHFVIPNSHQQGQTGVDTVFGIGYACDGSLYAVDIAYGVLLEIDFDAQQAFWVGSFGSAANASSSFQAPTLDARETEVCSCVEPSTPVPAPLLPVPPAPAERSAIACGHGESRGGSPWAGLALVVGAGLLRLRRRRSV